MMFNTYVGRVLPVRRGGGGGIVWVNFLKIAQDFAEFTEYLPFSA